MSHPLVDNLKDLSDNDLEERIASLHKKYWMTSNPQARAEKSIQNDDKNLDNLINIS